jgi:hypothetical protein
LRRNQASWSRPLSWRKSLAQPADRRLQLVGRAVDAPLLDEGAPDLVEVPVLAIDRQDVVEQRVRLREPELVPAQRRLELQEARLFEDVAGPFRQ